MSNICVAIDGPAGAGKSTVAKILAKRLNYLYLDTGAMYRCVALRALQNGVGTLDQDRLSKLVTNIDIEIHRVQDSLVILLDGEDVSKKIRTPEIAVGASNVATIPEVREKMTIIQQSIATNNSVVIEGRDIGTKVFPNASFKFFLTAKIEERARRRYIEDLGKDTSNNISLEQVVKDIEYRDKNDSSRKVAPLAKAEDAKEIDTTDMNIEEVVNLILYLMGESK